MQKKLSKHFIYNWLEEDAYGEYSLHGALTSRHSSKLLMNIWKFLLLRQNTSLGGLGGGEFFLPRYVSFTASLLRTCFMLNKPSFNLSYLSSIRSIINFNIFFNKVINLNLKPINIYVNSLLKKKIVVRRIVNGKRVLQTKIRFFKKLVWSGYIHFLRRRRKRNFSTRHKNLLFRRYFKSVSRRRKAGRSSRLLKAVKTYRLVSKPARFSKRIMFKKTYLRSSTFHVIKTSLAHFKKRLSLVQNIPIKAPLWRFQLPSSHFVVSSNPVKLLILLKQTFFRSWDFIAYKLKSKTRRFLNTKLFKHRANFQLRLAFQGFFKKPNMLVKRNEKPSLLRFRFLKYFNLVNTPRDYHSLYKNNTKKSSLFNYFRLPSVGVLEFQLSNILLRSNFFENGYIVASLIRRGSFIVNGNTSIAPTTPLAVWDIITIKKPLWWLVYARFINFFSSVISRVTTNKFYLGLKRHNFWLLPKMFLKKLFKSSTLFRKTTRHKKYLRSLKAGSILTNIVRLKNYVLTLPPSYLEISYKLFIIIICKLSIRSSDISYFLNLNSFKRALPLTYSSPNLNF